MADFEVRRSTRARKQSQPLQCITSKPYHISHPDTWDEDTIARFVKEATTSNKSWKEISEEFGTSESIVTHFWQKYKIGRPNLKKVFPLDAWNATQDLILLYLSIQAADPTRAAEVLGRTRRAINARKYGISEDGNGEEEDDGGEVGEREEGEEGEEDGEEEEGKNQFGLVVPDDLDEYELTAYEKEGVLALLKRFQAGETLI